jgi:hypothetical protein
MQIMKLLRQLILGAGLVVIFAQTAGAKADTAMNLPEFKEVYGLIHQHLAGESETDLDRAAVEGLLGQLRGKASLVSGPSGTNAQTDAPLLAKSSLYEGPIGYLRVGRVGQGLDAQIRSAISDLNGTNQLKGIIMDLRFADGRDYAAAAAAADLFVTKEEPLLDWGEGVVRSKSKTDAITLPVAVLVNRQTAAAAEALAAILRDSDRALVLGATTAGEATIDQEFPLQNGQRLRIATSTVKLGSGETLSEKGITPDIAVAVTPQDERVYFGDPFKEISKPLNLLASLGIPGTNGNGANGSNHINRARPTEADLIRERKERPGMELEYSVSPGRENEVTKPVVQDPVLGRALDLIKGISVLRTSKPA